MWEEEAVGEAPRVWRRGLVEEEVGGTLGWEGEEVEHPFQVGTAEEEEVQRRELLRVEEEEGRLGPGLEEEGEVLSRGVVEEEDGYLWMEEVEELVSVAHF